MSIRTLITIGIVLTLGAYGGGSIDEATTNNENNSNSLINAIDTAELGNGAFPNGIKFLGVR